jgi:hypothetical protein
MPLNAALGCTSFGGKALLPFPILGLHALPPLHSLMSACPHAWVAARSRTVPLAIRSWAMMRDCKRRQGYGRATSLRMSGNEDNGTSPEATSQSKPTSCKAATQQLKKHTILARALVTPNPLTMFP